MHITNYGGIHWLQARLGEDYQKRAHQEMAGAEQIFTYSRDGKDWSGEIGSGERHRRKIRS